MKFTFYVLLVFLAVWSFLLLTLLLDCNEVVDLPKNQVYI